MKYLFRTNDVHHTETINWLHKQKRDASLDYIGMEW